MKKKKSPKCSIVFDNDAEPAVISKHILDYILYQKDTTELIALFMLYRYLTKWPPEWPLIEMEPRLADALRWDIRKLKKYKKELIRLKLIEREEIKNEDGPPLLCITHGGCDESNQK